MLRDLSNRIDDMLVREDQTAFINDEAGPDDQEILALHSSLKEQGASQMPLRREKPYGSLP